ncbi:MULTISPECIES: hypothetical protein [unclassified Legionella]|uniref:hypothetical protein n=1 Tax=unclassified Legionella TaxID=2622702 RepID=UPI0010552DF7|nr:MULTISPECIES: hypothetical protein [unclassified Legionella]MDI9819799.1 hypothetical protein [Legionella sp. PL877]
MQFDSLLEYLNYQLPGLFTIRVRNFFSFLPFVKPVDKRIQSLRISVNQALANPGNYYYVDYYQQQEEFFYQCLHGDSFFYSADETTHKGAARSSFAIVMQQSATSVSPDALKDSPSSVMNLQKETLLQKIIKLLQKEFWEESVDELFAKLDRAEQLGLVRELIANTIETRYKTEKLCILHLVDILSLDQDSLKKELFDNLQNEESIRGYEYYLLLKGDFFRDELLDLIDHLGKKQANCETSSYGVQRDYHELKFSLRSMRDGKPIHEDETAVEKVAKQFESWNEKHNPSEEVITDLVKKIFSCIENLQLIIKSFKEPCLKEKYIKEQIAERKRISLEDERSEFRKQMREGKIVTVATQRLAELFPDEETLAKIKLQCTKLGIAIFDAEDPYARKEALREHNAMKSWGSTFNN